MPSENRAESLVDSFTMTTPVHVVNIVSCDDVVELLLRVTNDVLTYLRAQTANFEVLFYSHVVQCILNSVKFEALVRLEVFQFVEYVTVE